MFTERKKLKGEIERDFDHLAALEPYDEKYAKTTENLNQLYDLKKSGRQEFDRSDSWIARNWFTISILWNMDEQRL